LTAHRGVRSLATYENCRLAQLAQRRGQACVLLPSARTVGARPRGAGLVPTDRGSELSAARRACDRTCGRSRMRGQGAAWVAPSVIRGVLEPRRATPGNGSASDPMRTTSVLRRECARNAIPDPYLISMNAHCFDVDCRGLG